MSHNIEVVAGSSKKLLVGGKYCDRDIIVKALYKDVEEQEKTVEITESGVYEVTPDSGKLLSKVTAKVNVSGGLPPSEQLNYTWWVGPYWVDGRYYDGNPPNPILVIPETFDDGVNGEGNVEQIAGNAFYGDQYIVAVIFPSTCSWVDGNAFSECPNLRAVFNLPTCSSFAFSGSDVQYVQYADGATVRDYVFTNTPRIFDFTKYTRVATLEGTNGIPIVEGLDIHVPYWLVDEWSSATNWTLYSQYIHG